MSCLVHLFLQLFVGGIMSCLCEGLCLVCGRDYVLFGTSFPPVVCGRDYVLFVGGIMSCLHCLFLFGHCGFQHKYCVEFVGFFLFFFFGLVCPMLPVSLDCPFLIAPLVLSNVYLNSEGEQFHQYPPKKPYNHLSPLESLNSDGQQFHLYQQIP